MLGRILPRSSGADWLDAVGLALWLRMKSAKLPNFSPLAAAAGGPRGGDGGRDTLLFVLPLGPYRLDPPLPPWLLKRSPSTLRLEDDGGGGGGFVP